MKRTIAILLSLVMILALVGCGSSGSSSGGNTSTATSPDDSQSNASSDATVFGDGSQKFLTLAACPASSAMYPFWVSVGDILDTAFSNMHMTVSESQGAVAITKRVRSGECEMGNAVSATDYESFNGIGTFDGSADPDLRMIWYYEVTWEMYCVDAASGINSVTDLDGKKFNPGGTGTSAEAIAKKMSEILGYTPNWFTASQSDAADAYSNREIVGTIKLGPTVDSYVMQLNAAIPIDLITLTEDQVNAILTELPYLVSGVIPAGTYDGVDHDTVVVGTPQGCQTRVGNFTQQEQYQIFKAVMEDYADMWHNAYPVGAQNDVIGLTLQSPVLLASGTVQWLVEHGYDVPENLIPPEYVPVG